MNPLSFFPLSRMKSCVELVPVVLFLLISHCALLSQQRADPLTVAVVRDFGGELFLLNSVKYLNPLVQLLNSNVNARTYQSAEVARKNGFYIRIGVHGMVGAVNPEQFTYTPELPTATLDLARVGQYATIFPSVSIRDTAGLVGYAFRVVLGDGIREKKIELPANAPTFFGNTQQRFRIPKEYFRQRLQNPAAGDPLLLLPAATRTSVLPYIERLPDEYPLPSGQNLRFLPLAMPQIEIGSLFGTELLLRYLPQINWGNNIGNFGFAAVGLKHSLSQYMTNPPLELALQAVYQTTTLTNTIGVTGARLRADANIFTANVHASKRWGNFEVFGGLAYDNLNINASYTFVIPFELQGQLGLLQLQRDANGTFFYAVNAAEGYPGDTQPQTKTVALTDAALRGTLGMSYYLGPVVVSVDYNRSTFHLLSAGVAVKF